ncbi:hypothetical protein [Endozoicomonas elysicola]|nr:hypothetical protein [Endozoicomonas elysicola]
MKKCMACLLLASAPVFSDVLNPQSFLNEVESEVQSAVKPALEMVNVPIQSPSWLIGCWVDKEQAHSFFKVVPDGFYYKTWSEGSVSQFQMRDASGVYPRFQNTYSNPAYSRYTLNGTRKGDTSGGVFTDMNFSQGEDKDVIGVSGFLNGFLAAWSVSLISTTYKRSDDVNCNVESTDQSHLVY